MSGRPLVSGLLTAARRGLMLAIAAAVTWVAGLVWFAEAIPSQDRAAIPDTATDAIVVLTGGPLRLEAGLEALAAGRARRLFISGVGRGVELAELLRTTRHPPGIDAAAIVLGHAAADTEGNAFETRDWMAREGLHSLRLVTASFHLKRSLLEFRRAMPDTVFVPHPVFIETFKRDAWWAWPGTLSLIAIEYNKYIAAAVRPFLPAANAPRGAA